LVEPSTILQAQTAQADGTVFSGPNGQNGTGVAVMTGTLRKESGFELRLGAKDFGTEAASLAFFLLSRSCYARRHVGCSASGQNGGHRDGAQTNI